VNDDDPLRREVFGTHVVRNQTERDDTCRRPLDGGADAGRGLQSCDHLGTSRTGVELLSNVSRTCSRASNHPGETLTLDEQTFEVKGKYERVFAPNA
jgi:hypothetical protein